MKKTLSRTKATALGAKGGKATLRKRGRKHFAKISKMRKTFGGGRPPKKKAEEVA